MDRIYRIKNFKLEIRDSKFQIFNPALLILSILSIHVNFLPPSFHQTTEAHSRRATLLDSSHRRRARPRPGLRPTPFDTIGAAAGFAQERRAAARPAASAAARED